MQAKILFFIPDSNPNKEEQLAAAEIPAQVCFRNLRYIGEEDKPEECDGVFSLVRIPANYKHLPNAEQAIEKKRASHIAKLEKLGDKPAPGSKFEKAEQRRLEKMRQKQEIAAPGAPSGSTGATGTDPAASVGSPAGAAQTSGAWGSQGR